MDTRDEINRGHALTQARLAAHARRTTTDTRDAITYLPPTSKILIVDDLNFHCSQKERSISLGAHLGRGRPHLIICFRWGQQSVDCRGCLP